jgi:hypothetical protein
MTLGSETWTVTTVDTTLLRMFERKIVRKICGYVKEGERGIRTKKEMKDILQGGDIYEIPPTKMVWSC